MAEQADILIIGGGIIGLTVAYQLCLKGKQKVIVLEKEDQVGLHSSGRNSGVVHAGIYYPPNTLKARLCLRGADLLQKFAASHQIPMQRIGKVILAPEPEMAQALDQLYERAKKNGVIVEKINTSQLKEIEPEAYTHEYALYSPTTSIIDSKRTLKVLTEEIHKLGGTILYNNQVTKIDSTSRLVTTSSNENFGYQTLVNCAGLQSDKIAHLMEVGLRYTILPFRGSYLKLSAEFSSKIRGLIYPIPDLKMPFLGVHFTKTLDGSATVGPSAMPAFGRENYSGFSNVTFSDSKEILKNITKMALKNTDGIRNHIFAELKRTFKAGMYEDAKKMVPHLSKSDLSSSSKVGLRAQCFDKDKQRLEMDFVIEKGPDSIHVLNAVSPGFTAGFAFAEWMIEEYL